jgi:hypothetical protein
MNRQENVIALEQLTAPCNCPSDGTRVDPHQLLADAEVVYAVGGPHARDILVFGKEKLRRIAQSEIPEGARVVRVRVGSGSSELERLLDLVRQRKGYHDYVPVAKAS